MQQKLREGRSAMVSIICAAAFDYGLYALGASCGGVVVLGFLISTGER